MIVTERIGQIFIQISLYHIGINAAQYNVTAYAGLDHIRATDQRLDGLNQTQRDCSTTEPVFIARCCCDLTIVTKDQIITITGKDRIAITAICNYVTRCAYNAIDLNVVDQFAISTAENNILYRRLNRY